jgi:hypothetical protein
VSKSNYWENALLKLVFNATAIANIADNAASSPLTSLYVSVHTADPGEGGDQTTNETSYGSYARTAVARSVGGWTVTNNLVTPVGNIDFPSCSSGTATLTHLGIGTDLSGVGRLLYSGTITPNIAVSTGISPRLTTGTTISED